MDEYALYGKTAVRTGTASTSVTRSVSQTVTSGGDAQASSSEPGTAQQNGNTQQQNSGSGEVAGGPGGQASGG